MTEHEKITLVRAVQTCMSCPSQWDTWDQDGNYYYLRYRHGHGEMHQYQSPDWVDAPWKENVDETRPGWGIYANTEYIRTIAEFEYGHPMNGVISLGKFAELAGVTLAGNLMTTGFGDHLADGLVLRGVPLEQAEAVTKPWRDLDE